MSKKYYSLLTLLHLLVLTLLIMPVVSCQKSDSADMDPEEEKTPELTGILVTLKKEHPRLLLTEERLQELKALSNTDPTLKRYATNVIARADKDIPKSPIQHVLVGPRLLDKSRECLNRVYNLAFAYRWTGDAKYYHAAVANLKNVCNFNDWNPSHFLDVAEMSHAVGIGYDWLYKSMDEISRYEIRRGLIKLGLTPAIDAYKKKAWWTQNSFNWNQVCNSGMLIAALALAETDPDMALDIVPRAVENLPYALKSYGPDGVWGEGPGYWSYATDYTAFGIAALQTALGSDFGLLKSSGLNVTGYFPIYSAGPGGLMLNYADAGEKSKLAAPHAEMWLASVFNNTDFADFLADQLATRSADAWDVIWYRPASGNPPVRSTDKYFGGVVHLFFSRSAWGDPNALWVGVKAGYNKINHGHLDLGNFEMDALGVRWARDLGSDDYNLDGYFSGSTQTSPRWKYYRLNSQSHNVPLINGKDQEVTATSRITRHAAGVAEPFAIVDITEAYKSYCSSVMRGIRVVDNRTALLVQDEFVLTQKGTVTWGMTTDATIQIENPQQATLTLGGKTLTARILSPSQAVFSVASAEQSPPQKTNAGVSRLLATVPETTGNLTLTVLLSPHRTDAVPGMIPRPGALATW